RQRASPGALRRSRPLRGRDTGAQPLVCGSWAPIVTIGPTVLDRGGALFDIARFVQTLTERGHEVCGLGRRAAVEKSNHRQRALLRAPWERPCDRRAAEQRDELELAPPIGMVAVAAFAASPAGVVSAAIAATWL